MRTSWLNLKEAREEVRAHRAVANVVVAINWIGSRKSGDGLAFNTATKDVLRKTMRKRFKGTAHAAQSRAVMDG